MVGDSVSKRFEAMAINDYTTWVSVDSNVINRSQLYKRGRALPDRTVAMREQPYVLHREDYVVAAMFVMFVIVAFIVRSNRRNFSMRLKNVFSTKRNYADADGHESSAEKVGVVLLVAIGALCLSFMFLGEHIEQGDSIAVMGIPYDLLGVGAVAVLLFVIVKACLYALVNNTFFDREENKKWMSAYLILTALAALLIYPVTLAFLFSPLDRTIVIQTAVLIAIIYELTLFYKLLTNFKVQKHGYLLIILYFCSVEFMPGLLFAYAATQISDLIEIYNHTF